MPTVTPIVISSAVEGLVDEAVVKCLIVEAGGEIGPVYGKRGKSLLKQRINGYNNAAHHHPWIVLIDLNHEADCPPPLKAAWLPAPGPFMCFRIAVRKDSHKKDYQDEKLYKRKGFRSSDRMGPQGLFETLCYHCRKPGDDF